MLITTGPGRIEVSQEITTDRTLSAVLYNFDVDGDQPKKEHVDYLVREVAPRLRSPYSVVYLLGSASRVGSAGHNKDLSDRRLEGVAAVLRKNGVADYQMLRTAVGEALSFGPDPNNERHRAVAIMVVPGKRTPPKPTPQPIPRTTRYEPLQHIARGKPQFQLVVRTFIPFARFMGFAGDGRGYSTSSHVTYRTGMFVVFDLAEGRITEHPVGNSTGTRRDTADPKAYATVRVALKGWMGDKGRIMLSLHMEGSDPLVPGAPNVDTDIEVTAFLRDGNLYVAGEVIGDAFPSTEVFIRDNQRQGADLLHYTTPANLTGAIRLLGDGTRTLGKFNVGIQLDENSHFTGSRPWGG